MGSDAFLVVDITVGDDPSFTIEPMNVFVYIF